MTRALRTGLLVATLAPALAVAKPAAPAAPALGGSLRSMVRQNAVAQQEEFAFVRTAGQLRALAGEGVLERIESSADVRLLPYVHPYARPEVRLFVERLGAQYRASTGQPLVVTSLVRPTAEQPSNSHRLSVHPAGMALDLRVPADAKSRAWLERTLLALEAKGVLDVTREYHPPHYHVAVFPAEYRAYVAAHAIGSTPAAPKAEPMLAPAVAPVVAPAPARAAAAPAGRITVATSGLPVGALPLGALPLGAFAMLATVGGVVTIVRWRSARRVSLAG
jgi:hypothetical protein